MVNIATLAKSDRFMPIGILFSSLGNLNKRQRKIGNSSVLSANQQATAADAVMFVSVVRSKKPKTYTEMVDRKIKNDKNVPEEVMMVIVIV